MLHETQEVLRLAFRFRFRELARHQLFRAGLVGALGALIQFSFFELLGIRLAVVSPRTAAVLGAELGLLCVFVIHHFFTFSGREISPLRNIAQKFLYFNLAALGSLAIQYGAVWLGERVGGDSAWSLRAFNLLGILIGFVWNYMNYTRVIWKPDRPPAEL